MPFTNLKLTTFGQTLETKWRQGKGVHFTKIAFGDGLLGNESMINRTTLVSERHSVKIDAIVAADGATQAEVIATLDNSDFGAGFLYREIALMATDPDTGLEGTYLYDNAGQECEYLNTRDEGAIIHERMKLIIKSVQGRSITFEASGNPLYATDVDIANLQQQIDGKAASQHTHGWTEVTDKPTTYPPTSHTHGWAEVTDKPTTYPPSTHTHNTTDIQGLQEAMAAYLPLTGGKITGDLNVRDYLEVGPEHVVVNRTLVGRSAEFNGRVKLNSGLDVASSATVGNDLHVTGALDVGEHAKFSGTVTTEDALHTAGPLTVTLGMKTKKVDAEEYVAAPKITPDDTDKLRFMCKSGRTPLVSDKPLPIEWGGTGTATGAVKPTQLITVAALRNIRAGTASMTASASSLTNGEIYLQYS